MTSAKHTQTINQPRTNYVRAIIQATPSSRHIGVRVILNINLHKMRFISVYFCYIINSCIKCCPNVGNYRPLHIKACNLTSLREERSLGATNYIKPSLGNVLNIIRTFIDSLILCILRCRGDITQ